MTKKYRVIINDLAPIEVWSYDAESASRDAMRIHEITSGVPEEISKLVIEQSPWVHDHGVGTSAAEQLIRTCEYCSKTNGRHKLNYPSSRD